MTVDRLRAGLLQLYWNCQTAAPTSLIGLFARAGDDFYLLPGWTAAAATIITLENVQ